MVEKILGEMRKNSKHVRFADLCEVCEKFFGSGRQKGSHIVFKTPWPGDPRVNIQNEKGMAKSFQVKQVLNAIERLKYEK
jgi:predicted RNA binding protein YcfA (HicA-like mRNA interferase family)